MKRTTAFPLIALGLGGAVATYLLELFLQASGAPAILPPYSLSLTLVGVAIAVIALAVPVRRLITGKRKEPLNPFYAVRVAVLAKASSHAGALLLGVGVGLTFFLLARPIAPSWDLLGRALADLVSAAIVLSAGLIAERMCQLPPDDTDKESVGDPTARA
jgi:DMSO reductase anchor subunit